MLFDLQSPRRRGVIKVIYAMLAILMGGGLIFFGIGSDATGGLSEIFTGNDSSETGFEDQISEQEDKLVANPQDVAALTELVQLHFQAGTSQIEVDESTGQQNVTAEAEGELQKGADSWNQLSKATKGSPPNGAALTAVQTFSILAQAELTRAAGGSGQTALNDADDSLANWVAAAEAQATIAAQRDDADTFARLASLYYFGGEIEKGDEAAAKAQAASKGDEGEQLQKELDSVKKEGEQIVSQIEAFRKQLAQAGAGATGGATGENPLSEIGGGGLSGGGLSTP